MLSSAQLLSSAQYTKLAQVKFSESFNHWEFEAQNLLIFKIITSQKKLSKPAISFWESGLMGSFDGVRNMVWQRGGVVFLQSPLQPRSPKNVKPVRQGSTWALVAGERRLQDT